MKASILRSSRRLRRRRQIRKRVLGTPERPRLAVFRSHKNISAQVIDDLAGRTLCHASTRDKDLRGELAYGGNCTAAARIGRVIAQRAQDQGIRAVVFDRSGFLFHGRVKALADAAREGGLNF